jgi:transcriptional regulator with XRE-family HTH domain
MSFAKRAREAREAIRLTQGELALILGVSQGTIANKERGESVYNAKQLRQLSALGINPSYLLLSSNNVWDSGESPEAAIDRARKAYVEAYESAIAKL